MPKIPIFKSHYSIGRSILTLEDPKEVEEGGPSSIFKIAKDAGLKEIYLLEDNISSFPLAFKVSKKVGIPIRYGEMFYLKSSTPDSKETCKIGVFALNDDGFKELIRLHTKVYEAGETIGFEDLKSLSANLRLVIPFYDSFLHKSHFTFNIFLYDFAALKPLFFVEENGLPWDSKLAEIVKTYCQNNGCDIVDVQSIYYEKAEDISAYMTYRLICDRKETRGGTLEKPNIDGFGSDKFSWERFKEENL